jgi:cytidine deaminase
MPTHVHELVQAALEVRQRAYAKYSNFRVGAALLASDGKIYAGCNVENASYGLTICAERAAVFAAVGAGQQTFERIAIATSGGAAPCGACRQVLAEFAPDLEILLVDTDKSNATQRLSLRDLLPHSFSPANLNPEP